jgi:hypothetical protein
MKLTMYNCGRLQQHARPVDDIRTIILTTNNALHSLYQCFKHVFPLVVMQQGIEIYTD